MRALLRSRNTRLSLASGKCSERRLRSRTSPESNEASAPLATCCENLRARSVHDVVAAIANSEGFRTIYDNTKIGGYQPLHRSAQRTTVAYRRARRQQAPRLMGTQPKNNNAAPVSQPLALNAGPLGEHALSRRDSASSNRISAMGGSDHCTSHSGNPLGTAIFE